MVRSFQEIVDSKTIHLPKLVCWTFGCKIFYRKENNIYELRFKRSDTNRPTVVWNLAMRASSLSNCEKALGRTAWGLIHLVRLENGFYVVVSQYKYQANSSYSNGWSTRWLSRHVIMFIAMQFRFLRWEELPSPWLWSLHRPINPKHRGLLIGRMLKSEWVR